MPDGTVFDCHLNTGQPNHLKTRQMDPILFSYVLVQYSNGQSSSLYIAQKLNIDYQTILKYLNKSSIQTFPVFRYPLYKNYFDKV